MEKIAYRVSWQDANSATQAGLLRQPVTSTRELAAGADSALHLLADLLSEDLVRIPDDLGKVEYWLALGYSTSASKHLRALQVLANFSTGLLECGRLMKNELVEIGAHEIPQTEILGADTPYSQMHESLNRLEEYLKIEVLTKICHLVANYCSTEILNCVCSYKPLERNSVADRQAILQASVSLLNLVHSPFGLSMVSADLLSDLVDRAQTIQNCYESEYPLSLGLPVDEKKYIVLDVECLLSFMFVKLCRSAIITIFESEKDEIATDLTTKEVLKEHLQKNRFEVYSRLANDEITSLFLPSSSTDHWPSSVPEVEQILRNVLITSTYQSKNAQCLFERGAVIVDLGNNRNLLLVAPSYLFAPIVGSPEVIRQSAEEYPFFSWLAQPSTLSNHGYFSDSFFSNGVAKVQETLEYHEVNENMLAVRTKLVELGAIGAGAAYSGPLIHTMYPEIPSTAAAAIGAIAGDTLVRLSSRLTQKK